MKRISKILLFVLIILPFIVKADVGMPPMKEYDVKVINPDGTYLLRFNYKNGKEEFEKLKKLDYNTILKGITYEYNINGVLYGQYEGGYVLLKDCEVVSDIDLKEFDQSTGTLYVFKEGAYLYKGPSKAYDKVSDSMIPVGTELTYNYKDEYFANVTYNGMTGWVYYSSYGPYEEKNSVVLYSSEYIYTLEDTKVYSTYECKDYQTVPKNTKIERKFIIYDEKTYYGVNYNNKIGFVIYNNDDSIANMNNYFKLVTNNKELKVYSDIKLKNEVGTIKANEIVPIKYFTLEKYYVDNNNISGWVKFEDNVEMSIVAKRKINIDSYIYDNINGSETSKTLPAGTYISDFEIYNNYDETTWVHVIDKEYKGWVKVDSLEVSVDEYLDDYKEEASIVTKEDNKGIKDIIIYVIVGAVVLSLVAFVTIKLINKKKETENNA